jgi:hypothetical protein
VIRSEPGGFTDDGTYVSTFHNVNRTTYPLYGATVTPPYSSQT